MQQSVVLNEFSDVIAAIRPLLPKTVGVAVTDPTAARSARFAEEAACLPPMRALRRREFLAGREALRLAMSQIGQAPRPVGMNADRSPDLPPDTCASLSHTDTLCVAIADRIDRNAALGLDLEPDSPLDPDLWDTVCTRTERASLTRLDGVARGHAARRIFCAKEAAYKCQYTLSGCLLDFDAFDITFPADDRFEARFRQSVDPFVTGDRITGKIIHVADHIVTTAVIPA